MSKHHGRYVVADSVSEAFVRGLRPNHTPGPQGGFSLSHARAERTRMVNLLREIGAEVFEVPVGDNPDGFWVRDPVLFVKDHRTGEIFCIPLRPFDPLRRPEVEVMRRFVTETLQIPLIDELPKGALIEGGDFVPVGERGMIIHRDGPRSNRKGVRWMSDMLSSLGYDLVPMQFRGLAYHSDLAVGHIGPNAEGKPVCLVNPGFVHDLAPLREYGARILELPEDDYLCANTVQVNGALILPKDSNRVEHLIRTELPAKKLHVCSMPNLAMGDGGGRCSCVGIGRHN